LSATPATTVTRSPGTASPTRSRDAELLTGSIDDHLRGDAADLSRYEIARDSALRETFDLTCAISRYPALDEFVALQKRLSRALEVEADFLASLDLPVAA